MSAVASDCLRFPNAVKDQLNFTQNTSRYILFLSVNNASSHKAPRPTFIQT
ncbi:hypothetical protein PGT21_003768 [Puccinia graminis f. sp. tritici]|uniref:Uncharacterized protein n=1 Tax=Puccinia graminis f. sp. tritici TaxID=56615 RepID=A0A5B0SGB9_PUCGR|nr:hypothetical protein PGT21_003768 [Puccinia graminis f. sp. tritici]KAA1136917.1 hypothetical protein PGTUg99_004174 [Puccinia graminis f. sp. tritici]